MTYKVGSTTVIDSEGNINWARISGKPSIPDQGLTTLDAVHAGNGATTSNRISLTVTKNSTTKYTLTLTHNCRCNC